MSFTEFDSSYVGFTQDGAQYLVDNTDIKLVGKMLISPSCLHFHTFLFKIINLFSVL